VLAVVWRMCRFPFLCTDNSARPRPLRIAVAGAVLLVSSAAHALTREEAACRAWVARVGPGRPLATAQMRRTADRVLRPGMAATTDYVPSRRTLLIDDRGRVAGAECG
jgi:hypothetical protein